MIKTLVAFLSSRLRQSNLVETMYFYAVAKGRQPGIFSTWLECEAQIKGFAGAKFKKFSTKEEADSFVQNGGVASDCVLAQYSQPSASKIVPAAKKFTASSNSQQGNYYAVAKGKNVGIYSTWIECKAQVDDFKFPIYKKFPSLEEAEQFIKDRGASSSSGQSNKSLLGQKTAAPVISVRSLTTVAYGNSNFHRDDDGYVHCYTDGSCEGNGQAKARAGIGVWFGVDHPMNICKPVNGPPTNNVAEIEAATQAIQTAHSCGIAKLQINTDSQFLIKCITQWLPKWQKNGWKVSDGGDVKNKGQLIDLHQAMQANIEIKWNYVKAHKGIEGNEHADTLAKAGAACYKMKQTSKGEGSGVRFKPY